jgi:hypothetical protein
MGSNAPPLTLRCTSKPLLLVSDAVVQWILFDVLFLVAWKEAS